MATFNQIREAVRAQPFVPFVIHLADDRTFDVNHPEVVAVSPAGRELVFVGDDEGIHQLDMLLIAEIETPSKRRGDNGERGARRGPKKKGG